MKIVLTGGPSCGKSSVIELLKKQGYNTIDEVARKYMEEKNLQGKRLPEKEFIKMQEDIFQKYEELEHEADKTNEKYFLDRSSIDGHGYCQHILGYIPKTIEKPSTKKHDLVFLLDRLPLKQDGLRWEKDNDEGQRIHDLIAKSYVNLGYTPIRVPVIETKTLNQAIRKRANYIKRFTDLEYEGAIGIYSKITYKGRTIHYQEDHETIKKLNTDYQEN